MKNLKKLSVVLMLTTLFSVSFTSCIDNEVSPIVERIYQEQANLIAAQAAVQNAEAALRMARAEAEQAQAEYLRAQAAHVDAQTANLEGDTAWEAAQREQWLRELMAETDLAVAEAAMELAIAEAEFEIELAELMAELEEAGVQLAIDYAFKYAAAVNHTNNLIAQKMTKESQLAEAQLMIKGDVTWDFYLAGLADDLGEEEAKKAAAEMAIAMYQEAKENPTALETQKSDLLAQMAEQLEMQKGLAVDLVEAQAVQNAAQEELNDAQAFMTSPTGEYAMKKAALDGYQAALAANNATITANTNLIAQLDPIIADYDGIKTILAQAVADAEERIGAEEMDNHPSNHAPGFGLLGDIETLENEIGTAIATLLRDENGTPADPTDDTLASPIASPDTLEEAFWNACLAVATAEHALDLHNYHFDALVATYNAAAVALQLAQAAYDAADYAGDLATAQAAETAAQGVWDAAEQNYQDMKTAFEAAPNGSVDVDGPMQVVDDLGEIGIVGDGEAKTYMRVTGWAETSLGSNEYIPTALTGQFDAAGLAAEVAALIADAGNGIGADADIVLWEQDGTATDAALVATTLIDGGGSGAFINNTEVVDAANNDVAYFLEVEDGDTSVTNLYNFNVATNEWGQDDFADRAIVGNPGAGNYMPPLTAGNNSASYDTTPDAEGEADGGPGWALTAQAELWNAKLEVAYRQYLLDTGDDALQDAQDDFDVQKELFDNGVATRATLEAAVTAAEDAKTNGAKADLDNANDDLQDLKDELGTEYDTGVRLLDGTFLPITWDVHANDGLPSGSEIYEYRADGSWGSELTAYAALWNAQLAYALHTATTLAQYKAQKTAAEAAIAQATLEAAENQILIDKAQADLDEIQARYDELILTPLYAALEVALLEAKQAKQAVEDDIAASEALYKLVVNTPPTPNVESGTLWDIYKVLAEQYGPNPDYDALIAAEQTKWDTAVEEIEKLEVKIAKGELDVADIEADIEAYIAEIAVLEQRIANAQAIADEYKALMEAALAS